MQTKRQSNRAGIQKLASSFSTMVEDTNTVYVQFETFSTQTQRYVGFDTLSSMGRDKKILWIWEFQHQGERHKTLIDLETFSTMDRDKDRDCCHCCNSIINHSISNSNHSQWWMQPCIYSKVNQFISLLCIYMDLLWLKQKLYKLEKDTFGKRMKGSQEMRGKDRTRESQSVHFCPLLLICVLHQT